MNTGVIIARFQSPYLHEGHKHLIENAMKKHAKLIIVLGISPVTGSRRNPYDYFTRERMIKQAYPNLVILPLCDLPSDQDWSNALDQLLRQTFPCESFVLYGSRNSFIDYYSGHFTTVELPNHKGFNATAIREQYSKQISNSPDFRAGIVYAYYNQYTKVYPTVDVVLFRKKRTELLLGKKANSNKWRFVGCFADPEDDCFKSAALRELKEECGNIKVNDLTYEFSHKVDDWRYRSEVDKIITTVFSCDYISGTLQAQDDIIDLKWFALENLPSMMANNELAEEHIPILRKLSPYGKVLGISY